MRHARLMLTVLAIGLSGCGQERPVGDKSAGEQKAAEQGVPDECVRDGPVQASLLKIAVVPKGTTHEFWKAIHAGAVKAELEIDGVQIIWKGPTKEDDRTKQIDVVENFINAGVTGIALAPLGIRDCISVNPTSLARSPERSSHSAGFAAARLAPMVSNSARVRFIV